jgi:hypothetical protein
MLWISLLLVGVTGGAVTTLYDTKRTPDYSPLVVHFTKGKKMIMSDLIEETHPLFEFRTASSLDRLVNILMERKIYASPMPFLPRHANAVCFSECIWEGLAALSEQYSAYGVVFSKRLIFRKGGGPALYMRGDHLKDLGESVPPSIEPFIAPFDPEAVLQPRVPLEFLHEREWRLPGVLDFEYSDIENVLVETIGDAVTVIDQVGKGNLQEDRLIPMDVHRSIKRSWRT